MGCYSDKHLSLEMMKKQYNFILIILTICAFTLFSVAMLSIWMHPTTGIESSIYTSTPLVYWIAVMFGYCLATVLIILNIFNCNLYKPLRHIGLLLLFFCTLSLVSLFIIRGYLPLYITSDTGTHIGYLESLLTSGTTNTIYPALITETAFIKLLTDLPIFSLINLNSLIFGFIFLLGIYLLAKVVFKNNNNLIILTLLITCLFPFGSSSFMTGIFSFSYYLPYLAAFMLVPIFLYLIFRTINEGSNSKYYLLLCIICLGAILIYHPLVFIIVTSISITILIFLCFYQRKSIHLFTNLRKIIMIICFSAIIFFVRTWSLNILQNRILSVYDLVFEGNSDTVRLETLIGQGDFLTQFSYSDVLDILIRQIGLLGILIMFILISLPILFSDFKNEKKYSNVILLLCGLILPAVIFLGISFSMKEASFQYGRIVLFISLSAIFSAGLVFYKIIIIIKFSQLKFKKYILTTLTLLLVVFVGILGVISYYPATETLATTTQVTNETLEGMNFYITNINYDFYSVGIGINPQRFVLTIYNTRYIRLGSEDTTFTGGYLPNPPHHFNYNFSEQLGSSYISETYLLTREFQKIRSRELDKPHLFEWDLEDFSHLSGDRSIIKIYDSDDIDLYLMHGLGLQNYE